MMHESTLKQRAFDQLINAIALLWMLDASEIEEIATAFEDTSKHGEILDGKVMSAMAAAIRNAKLEG